MTPQVKHRDRVMEPHTADLGQTGTENWHVLADPEGNEFCLLQVRPLSL